MYNDLYSGDSHSCGFLQWEEMTPMYTCKPNKFQIDGKFN
jgi:hypothetical protein